MREQSCLGEEQVKGTHAVDEEQVCLREAQFAALFRSRDWHPPTEGRIQ